MDKKEAMNIFFKRYSSILKQNPFLNKDFNKLKRDFFIQIAKLSRTPSNKDIANEALEYMFKLNQINKVEELDSFFSYPFFKDYIHNKKYYYDKLEISNKEFKPIIEPEKLKDAEYKEKILEELTEKALNKIKIEKQREINELEEKILKKKEEYLEYPSILDSNLYEMPKENNNLEEDANDYIYIPWWKRLNLKNDPFQVLEGLAKIDVSLHEQIIQKTKIFQKYESMLSNSSLELYKNTVIFGQYGSGKTTFFDYFYYKFPDKKIIPIYIQQSGIYELRELVFEFRKKLLDELQKKYYIYIGDPTGFDESYNDEQRISQILRKFIERKFEGFIIIIDDLHKGDMQKALNFISHIQVFTSQLVRSTYNLNLGIFIAGHTKWETAIENDPKFSGSVARTEKMPTLTVDDFYFAINNRLSAYSINPDNPRKIDYAFIEETYNEMKLLNEDITFRDLIRKTLNKLESAEFSILASNPINIPLVALKDIKYMINKDITLSSRFYGLTNTNLYNQYQIKKCLENLIDIYLNNGLLEKDIRENNAPFLKVLAINNLIQKTFSEKSLEWKISKLLWDKNREIIEKYQLSLEDYLLKIYLTEYKDIDEKVIIEKPELEALDYLLKKEKKNSILVVLEQSKEIHQLIINLSDIEIMQTDKNELINQCMSSLTLLSKAYFEFERLNIDLDLSDLEVLGLWEDFWWSPEPIHQFIRATKLDDSNIQLVIPHILNLYRESYPLVTSFYKQEVEDSKQFRIPINYLRNDEISLLHECRELWKNSEYYEISRKLTMHIERKIRDYLYNIFYILYGDYKNRIKRIDNNSKIYIEQNIEKDKMNKFSIPNNEFKQLNRGQYKNIMTGLHGSIEGKNNWDEIFKFSFAPWKNMHLDAYLDQFAEINTKTSHLKDDSISIEQITYVYEFIIGSIQFIKALNNTYIKLLEKQNCEYENNIFFSFSNFKDIDKINPITIKKEDANKFKQILLKKEYIKIRLDDREYLEGLFGLDYRFIIGLLAILKNQSEDEINETKMILDIKYLNGCEIAVRLLQK